METKEIIYGRNPVLEYLKSGAAGPGSELYVAENAHGKIIDIIVAEAKRKKIPVYTREKPFFTAIEASARHQGVILKTPKLERPAGESPTLADIAASGGVIVLLDQLTDPHNVGSIIRTAEALGASGIILPESHSAAMGPTVVKSSAGATAHLPVINVTNVATFLEEAKDAGFWIIGADSEGTDELAKARTRRPAILVIGSEGSGMRRLTREKCDSLVSIPLKGKIASLNASVAAGILLWELLREDL